MGQCRNPRKPMSIQETAALLGATRFRERGNGEVEFYRGETVLGSCKNPTPAIAGLSLDDLPQTEGVTFDLDQVNRGTMSFPRPAVVTGDHRVGWAFITPPGIQLTNKFKDDNIETHRRNIHG